MSCTKTDYIANVTAITSDIINHIENKVDINIEDYSSYATDSDYSEALTYILTNISDNIKRVTVHFDKNKTYIINCNINKKYITLTGNATINGCLNIGLSDTEISSSTSWYDTFMGCIIEGLHFEPSIVWANYASNTTQGIRLKNARDVRIHNCTFKNMVYPIKLLSRQKTQTQHVNRVYISNCNFFCVSYDLYAEKATDETLDGFFEYGDITFQNNNCQETKVQNIMLNRVDGFMCQGNTFFLERVNNNINIFCSTIINISNNQLFEAGSSAIVLRYVYVANINNNNIYWSGLVDKESAIKIVGYNCWGDNKILAMITGNIIEKPYGDGISIVKGIDTTILAQGIVISNNIIYLRDTTNYMAVRNDANGIGMVIDGNITNSLMKRSNIGAYSSASINSKLDDKATLYINVEEQWINTTGTIAITKSCLNIIYFTSSTTTTVNDIIIGTSVEKGNELLLVNKSETNQCISNGSYIKTTTGTTITLLPHTIAKFIYVAGYYAQI